MSTDFSDRMLCSGNGMSEIVFSNITVKANVWSHDSAEVAGLTFPHKTRVF